MGVTREEVAQITERLLKASMSMGLYVNENKTKYMVMSRTNLNINDLLVNNWKFKAVNNFKYLGSNVNDKNNMHQEINERTTNENRCYYSIIKLSS